MRAIAAIVVVSLVALASADGTPDSFGGGYTPRGSTYIAQLSPRNPIPPVTNPVDARASGTFVATLDERFRTLTFQLWINNVNKFISAHIHIGNRTTNGPRIAFLFPTLPPGFNLTAGLPTVTPVNLCNLVLTDVIQPQDLSPVPGVVDSNGNGPDADETWEFFVQNLKAGTAYVDVHTPFYLPPTSILRAQITQSGRSYGNTLSCPRTSYNFKHSSAKSGH